MTANENAASFANVAQELQRALAPMDLAQLGCDEITQKQVCITLEQLGKVQAPFPEEQQKTMILVRKLAERMRVDHTPLANLAAAEKGSAAHQLREVIHNVLDGSVPALVQIPWKCSWS
jgi:hypothetical protein